MNHKFLYIVIGMSVVTYIPRALPALGLSRVKLPKWFLLFLDYIPVSVLSALLIPSIAVQDKKIDFVNPYFMASIPTVIAAYKSKNIFITIIVGIISFLAFRAIMQH
ncbi:AzlD domain-containing protein [Caldanaerobius polysaccharolyticus]|uniref:AzlD domain-containing protein n=1 Tax=Caldanaerobius polysaccharolyticus TaxID=44256 RepID=UPI00047AA4B4|nr:AzlD domain-containing protein [Caldanaerobius polysaccharolyticus]